MQHKKGLYFDGHNWPDVLEYQQNVFLPLMEKYHERLVEYVVGDVDKEVLKPWNCVERLLVLVPQDESTMQAHDGEEFSWVYEGDQPLKHKGPGCSLHESSVICSTVGWLEGASTTIEYGKNYDGYWTGELFVKQVNN